MFKKKYLLLFPFVLLIVTSCLQENFNTPDCTYQNLGITNQDTSFNGNSNSYKWNVRYNQNQVELYIVLGYGHHGEHDTIGYVFQKVNDLRSNSACLEFSYGYVHSTGYVGTIDLGKTRSIRSAPVHDVQIQEWIENERFVGQLVVPANSTGGLSTLKFWVDYDSDDYYEYENNTASASYCIDPVVPMNIDINHDGIDDFSFQNVTLELNTGLPKKFSSFSIIPLNNNIILERSPSSFTNLVFEPPFSSANAYEIQNTNFITNALAILEEFEPPYDRFDFWHYGNFTIHYYHPDHPYGFNNDIDDYILVKLEKDGQYYYGWIKLLVKNYECHFEILETYISPIPNQHVSIP